MNIAITCYPTYGGSGVVATELGLELASRGHEIHFICYDKPYRLPDFAENVYYHEVEVSKYPLFDYPPYSLALASRMVDIIQKHDIKILHVHYAIPHATSAYLAKKILNDKIKIVTTLHGTDITIVGADPTFYNITKFSMENSDAITTVSNYLKEETISTFKLKKEINVIHNFINPEKIRGTNIPCKKSYFSPNNEKIMIHVSNFRKVKRLEDVIEIANRVIKKTPSKLILIGDGPERVKAENLARDLGITENVSFLGKQSDVWRFYKLADVLLFPSQRESFGLAALEALCFGVPVIAARSGGIPEVVVDGKCGFLSELGDVEKMANDTLRILTNEELYQQFRAYACEYSSTNFNSDFIIEKYEKVYQTALNE